MKADDPVRAMRRIALAMPLVLVVLLILVAAIRAGIDGTPFAFRFDGALTGGLGGIALAFATNAAACRDEAAFRTTRNWFFASLALMIATAAAITEIRGYRWGGVAGFSVAALAIGLFAVVLARSRWLARAERAG